jgi:hypothetical protein
MTDGVMPDGAVIVTVSEPVLGPAGEWLLLHASGITVTIPPAIQRLAILRRQCIAITPCCLPERTPPQNQCNSAQEIVVCGWCL